MTLLNYGSVAIGNYRGNIAPEFDDETLRAQLVQIAEQLHQPQVVRLSEGVDYVVKLPLRTATGEIIVALKIFKRQGWLKDRYDRNNKSKAERSYNAARYLQEHHIGTPAPVAWLDRWDNNRLLESYLLCIYQPAICLRDALNDIYYHARNNEPLMELMQSVAPAVRAMHDAQFMHGDMGNQNILLPKNSDGTWAQPQFIDLNRARIPNRSLTDKERAFDLSRPIIPGNYLSFFKHIYCEHQDIPHALDKYEATYRTRFERHRQLRNFRHPLRYLKNRHNPPNPIEYPNAKDYWLWDEKTAQPMIALSRAEKNRELTLINTLKVIVHALTVVPHLYSQYKKLKRLSFKQPVVLKNRIGVALHPHNNYIEQELELLTTLGNPPVLIRFCRHESAAIWDQTIALIHKLHGDGVEVMIALLQDRQAVLVPELWSAFLHKIIPAVANHVSHIEVTHALNRSKWGIWNIQEWQRLMEPAFALQQKYPQIKLTGPACIDFEWLAVIAALQSLPQGRIFSALSHLLYVDRRGAPENPQGHFSTLEKCALLKAITNISPHCEDKVIISEVNWPAEKADVWSPIVCPYETPSWRNRGSGETEANYANYMLRYIVIAICSGHVEQLFWWRLSAKGYGLVDDQNQFKPRLAFHALQYFFVRLGDATFIKKWPSAKNTYVMEFHNATQQILMVWTTQGASNDLPKFDATHCHDRDGNELKDVVISEAPVYLVRPLL